MNAKPLQDAMTVERLIDRRYRVSIGSSVGIGKTEKAARTACEVQAVDALKNCKPVRMEVRHGYLIVSQVESSQNAWYTIAKVSALEDMKNGRIYSQTHMMPGGLEKAIDSHLEQYMQQDEVEKRKG